MNNLPVESYSQAQYPVIGSSPRTLKLLIDALENEKEDRLSDVYGTGELIESFQTKVAALLGKESAVFFPSGTMAQQIALRIWCERRNVRKAAYHPLCHLEIHEQNGLEELHGIESVLLGAEDRLLTLDDVKAMGEEIGCLLLELPQREIGGQLPSFDELEAISRYCREKGIPLHLDGARLFEIVPYYDRSEAEICCLFDSVYVSFYKGLGGLAGAILAGDSDLTEQSKVWKRRHGGDLISLYPYILSADQALELRRPRMELYFNGAKELSSKLSRCRQLHVVPEQPVSNMFHLHISLPLDRAASVLNQVCKESGVGLASFVRETSAASCCTEIHIGDRYLSIPQEKLDEALQLLERLLGEAAAE
ncbi:beta-eliminating lyase-related protein [Paenibacillus pasadenensis]|uniref:threonine aldolase family protein n=1 Tax=Paenibacillus pasadenensis TaxID=217090 RepID=UPI00203B3748|nr:beta-eliminating lyase-related protein [Paenibacillus pasadenensis]MCM3750185.1 beta-eliminating lyase-related protein [Paenibacillus pasadenensis]